MWKFFFDAVQHKQLFNYRVIANTKILWGLMICYGHSIVNNGMNLLYYDPQFTLWINLIIPSLNKSLFLFKLQWFKFI